METMDYSRCDRRPLDEFLGSGKFGCGYELLSNISQLYAGLSTILRYHLPSEVPQLASAKLASAENTSHDCVLRRCIDESFAALTAGDKQSSAAKINSYVDISQACPIAGPAMHHYAGPLTIFSDWSLDPFARSVADRFIASMADEAIEINLTYSTLAHAEKIKNALSLLKEVLPKTSEETLLLCPGVAVISGTVSSAYINDNPFCFLINETQFSDDALLAETILHESLHQKMVDIRLSSNLLREGYDDFGSEERGDVLVPWPSIENPRKWSAARALAAHHVYVHISALYAGIIKIANSIEIGVSKETLMERFAKAFERAEYLSWALKSPSLDLVWAHDGASILHWLDVPIRTLRNETKDVIYDRNSREWYAAIRSLKAGSLGEGCAIRAT